MSIQKSRRAFLSSLGIAGTALLSGLSARLRGAGQKKPPNILVILADDMGFSDAGCYGGDIDTPNLDALAAGGLRFSQCYSTGRCWPSRACLMTGYYAQQVRMDPPRGRLPEWSRCVPHFLKPVGYKCYHSGKWHVKGAPKAVADAGFDHSYLYRGWDRFFSPKVHFEDDQPLPPVQQGTGYYATCAKADYAIKHLKDHAREAPARPFFQYLAFVAPHFPLHALQKDIDRYRDRYIAGWDVHRKKRLERQRAMGLLSCDLSEPMQDTVPDWNLPEAELKKEIGPGEAGFAVPWKTLTAAQKKFQALKMAIHAAMITRMDHEIGRVLAQIKAMGEWENTVVFFMSDNGASAEQIIRGDQHDPEAPAGSAKSYLCLGPGWSTACNTPFRLHKSWMHEGGIASPLIVHWPSGIKARGALRRDVCHFIDIVPTVLDLAGKPMDRATPKAPSFPGTSLRPAFEQDGSVHHDCLYWHHMSNRAIQQDGWKLVAGGCTRGPGPWELYHLKEDRSEMRNLAARHPDKVAALAALWEHTETAFRMQAGIPLKSRSGAAGPLAMRGKVALAVDEKTGTLQFLVNRKEALVYRFNAGQDLVHYFPVRSPSGKSMTVQKTEPYPHHRSFWFGDTVQLEGKRKASFYSPLYSKKSTDEKAPYPDRVRHDRFLINKASGGGAQVQSALVWEMDGGTPVLDEIRDVQMISLGGGEYFLDMLFKVQAAYGDVKFVSDWVHYAWPYIRMNKTFSVDGGGIITNSAGQINQKETNGMPAVWVDYTNTVDGITEGLAVFSHPQNGHPHKWLTRDYGCFGPRRPDARSGKAFTLKKGEALMQRVGVLVHTGSVKTGKVAQRYRVFAKSQPR